MATILVEGLLVMTQVVRIPERYPETVGATMDWRTFQIVVPNCGFFDWLLLM